MEKEIKIYRREGSRITPNCFALVLNENKDGFNFSFGEMNKENLRVDILSEMTLPEGGFITILKSMFRVAFEYEQETGKDLIDQALNEMEEVGANENKSK